MRAVPTASDAPPIRWEFLTRFSPSGNTLIVDHHGGVAFWDAALGTIRAFATCDRLHAYSAAQVMVRRGDALVALDIESGAECWSHALTAKHESLYVAGAVWLHTDHQQVVALEADSGRERYRLADAAIKLHDRELFVTVDTARFATVREIERGREQVTIGPRSFGGFALSRDRKWLATTDDSRIDLWELPGGQLRHSFTQGYSSNGIRFREDSAALEVWGYQTQQSGNQDWNTEVVYDVATGKVLSDEGWWDQDAPPETPRELAPGVFRTERELTADGRKLELPDKAVVGVAADGTIRVAKTIGKVELYLVER